MKAHVEVLFLSPFQVWGAKEGPYEFKPAPSSAANFNGTSSLNLSTSQAVEKGIEGSFVLQE